MTPTIDAELVTLLRLTVDGGASDLHLTVGRPPTVRRSGNLIPIEGHDDLMPGDLERMVFSLLDDTKTAEYDRSRQVDFSFGLPGVGRFRANAFRQRGFPALALRVVPNRVRSLEELKAPDACSQLLNAPYGLVLVVGPTGSGKSTTLAAMIDRINEERPCHNPHHRGSGGVRAHAQARHREPARGGYRREQLRGRLAFGAARRIPT